MERLDVREFIAGFLVEAEEHLASASTNLVALDASLHKQEDNPRAVRELFRSLHTLKGLSAMVGAEPIVDISHEMETLLRTADRAGGKLPESSVDILIQGVRAIEERVRCLSRGEPLAAAPKDLLERLSSIGVIEGDEAVEETLVLEPELSAKLSLAERKQLISGIEKGQRALRVDFVPSPARSAAGINITNVRKQMSALGELVKVLPRAVNDGSGAGVAFVLLVLTQAPDTAIAEAAATTPEGVRPITSRVVRREVRTPAATEGQDVETHKHNYVRVDVSRLDEALERLGVLVVSRSRLQRAVDELSQGEGDVRLVARLVSEGARELRDLRAAIMRARMVSVAELLERAPLIVRGLSKASKKLVRLTLDAGNAELDKAVADRLFPAVVHLLRNAVDHAIELPEERRARGKPEEGHVHVSCVEHAGSQLELVIEDDGRGIDRERVAARAGVAVPATDEELLGLITRTGLSTLEKATQTSGRGLGMDIVKRIAVGELGGELGLETQTNVGTKFTLRVPLSITIMDAFSLSCGNETFVVPVSAVDDLVEISAEAVSQTPEPQRRVQHVRLLRHRGGTMPLFRLSALLGLPTSDTARPKAVIVRRQSEVFAFEVDRMLGKQEVVVRPVKDPLVSVAGVSGSTDLGDGRPTLVLDLLGLLRLERTAGAGAA